METQHLYTPDKFIKLLQKRAIQDENTTEKKTSIKFKLNKKPTEVKTPEPILLEKLRRLEKISEEEFKQIFNFKAQGSAEFFKLVGCQLPRMSDNLLIHLMDFLSLEVKKHWALRARCVAEAYKRCPKLLGGRNKKAKEGEGRGNLVELLAERFGTSKTNIRIDEQIMRTFSTHHEIETESDSESVFSKLEPDEFVITRSADNEFFADLATRSENKPNAIDVFTFQPHPKLSRQHYVVATRLYPQYARLAIEEAITEIEAGNNYTAAEMERRLFPRKESRPGTFKLERAPYPNSAIKLEVTFDDSDIQILYRILADELGITVFQLSKHSLGERLLSDKGFSSFMNILKKYHENKKEI